MRQFGATGLEIVTLLAIAAVFAYVAVIAKPHDPAAAHEQAPRGPDLSREHGPQSVVDGEPAAHLRRGRPISRESIGLSGANGNGVSTQNTHDRVFSAVSPGQHFAEIAPPQRD